MSTGVEVIGEHDVVVLLTTVGRWPTGTRGTIVIDRPARKIVEIQGIENSEDDILEFLPEVATENLRLVSECPDAGATASSV